MSHFKWDKQTACQTLRMLLMPFVLREWAVPVGLNVAHLLNCNHVQLCGARLTVTLETRTLSGQVSRNTLFRHGEWWSGRTRRSWAAISHLNFWRPLAVSWSLVVPSPIRCHLATTDQAVLCGAPNAELPCGLQGTLAGIRGEACWHSVIRSRWPERVHLWSGKLYS